MFISVDSSCITALEFEEFLFRWNRCSRKHCFDGFIEARTMRQLVRRSPQRVIRPAVMDTGNKLLSTDPPILAVDMCNMRRRRGRFRLRALGSSCGGVALTRTLARAVSASVIGSGRVSYVDCRPRAVAQGGEGNERVSCSVAGGGIRAAHDLRKYARQHLDVCALAHDIPLLGAPTYHRGQVTALLRQLGVEPPKVDFLDAQDAGFRV